jgi:tripartite-type tricarboxylate transporter receptor subunit TctC
MKIEKYVKGKCGKEAGADFRLPPSDFRLKVPTFFLGCFCVTGAAIAQPYPAKPVRVVIAQAPASATDLTARIIANKLTDFLGQPVVVEARPGAGGLVGAEFVAKAPADGYTVLFANISTHGVNPALSRKMPYDAVRDFSPIVLATTTPNVLVVHPSLPVKTVREFIAFAKARPGQLNFATPGSGSSQHLATELFKAMGGGINSTHVPYKGTTPAMVALVAGEITWMIPTLTSALPQIKANKIRAIAVTTVAPVEDLPGLPTVAATLPGFEVVSWFGLVSPAGTPRPVVARLNEETVKTLALPDVRKSLAAIGMTPEGGAPEKFGAYIQSEVAKWTKVVQQANIQPE